MSWRIVCLVEPPAPQAYGWADAIIHDQTTIQEIVAIAQHYAWQRPLKIRRVPGKLPRSWICLKLLLEEEFSVPESDYSIEELTELEGTP